MWDSKRDTDVKNRLLDSVGEGEGGMIWENSIETCILSYVKQITSPSSFHDTRCSGLVQWDDPERWDGEGGGRGVQDGEQMYTHGWFMSMYGKNHYNIVISLQLKKKHCDICKVSAVPLSKPAWVELCTFSVILGFCWGLIGILILTWNNT